MQKLLWLLPLLLATGCPDSPTWLDNGLMVRDGLELHVDFFPQTVTADDLEGDTELLPEAVTWWNDQLDFEAFEQVDHIADINVTIGYVPITDWNPEYPDQGEAGLAEVTYDSSGVINDCQVTLSSDVSYHRPTLLQVLKHELGHCLGLDDDPGPPTTVDLRSVMGVPLDPLGEVTDHDQELIEAMR